MSIRNQDRVKFRDLTAFARAGAIAQKACGVVPGIKHVFVVPRRLFLGVAGEKSVGAQLIDVSEQTGEFDIVLYLPQILEFEMAVLGQVKADGQIGSLRIVA